MQYNTIELMLPVYNEEDALVRNVPDLVGYIDTLPYAIVLHIVDNASSDRTQIVGEALATRYTRVRYTRLPEKGRGYALTQAWLASEADIVGYMDIDLSTDLKHLDALLMPLLQDEADLSVGSRLSKTSDVHNRSLKREILSRGYNRALRFAMALPVHDAQCGFKAIRREMFQQLSAEITDTQWFFDTELILATSYAGHRIVEVPVHWVDDRRSTVNVARTVREDLSGMWRMYRAHRPDSLFTRLFSFGSIGMLTLIGYLGMYALVSLVLPAQVANLLTLIAMTLINTALNRRFTFRRTGLAGLHFHYAAGAIAFFLSWGVSAGGIWLLFKINPGISHISESVWVALFSLAATGVKYFVFSLGFRTRKHEPLAPAALEEKEMELV